MIEVYTDGSCSRNPGPGGWGIYLIKNGECIHKECGGDIHTTNNRMELFAVIRALEWIHANVDISRGRENIVLYTDSIYVQKGAMEWITTWKKNNWLQNEKKSVKNRDLWEQIDHLLTPVIRFEWVKGHDVCVGNNKADALARQGCRAQIDNRENII